jgi:hypothetical protein
LARRELEAQLGRWRHMLRRWKRIDFPGFETLHLDGDADGLRARSVIVDNGDTPFGLTADWRLDRDWVSRSLHLTLIRDAGVRELAIARTGATSWRVDGEPRPDLEGCLEVDVSATPFCNGLALRRLGREPGELTALYVLASDLSVQPSRQRYERAGADWRYVDLGAAKGFTAVLRFDKDLIVRDYEGLFQALD